MFDVGFWELVLCAVVALIVLGPERMPVAVRSVAHWLGAAHSECHRAVEGQLAATHHG